MYVCLLYVVLPDFALTCFSQSSISFSFALPFFISSCFFPLLLFLPFLLFPFFGFSCFPFFSSSSSPQGLLGFVAAVGALLRWSRDSIRRLPTAEAMGSIDAEVEIDMDISDDEQERAVVAQVVDGRVGKLNPSTVPSITDTDSSRKRKRSSSEERSPSVRIEYSNLPMESRRKLQEVLREWSLWQGYHNRHSFSESRDNVVESGEEQYFPALQVGPVGNSFGVAFWVDKPSKQSRRNEFVDSRGIIRTSDQDLRESEADVPLYDRVTPSLSTQESRKDGRVELEREAIRCFNCGSYSHGLRDCKRQMNYDAINAARANHASKKNYSSGPRTATRYYETHHIEEPDRAPWQPHQTLPLHVNAGKETINSFFSSEKKEEKKPSTEDNEEGEIVDGVVGTSSVEEETYIPFSPEPATPQAPDRETPLEHSGARVLHNTSAFEPRPERLWRSPPASYSPPIHMHPNFHHQRSFAYPPQNPIYAHTPPPVVHGASPVQHQGASPVQHHGGVNQTQRSWSDDRHHPQRPWDGRTLYYNSEIKNTSPAPMNGSNVAPVVSSVQSKKEDDDWELNFESSVYHSEISRSTFVGVAPGSAVGVPGATAEQHYTSPASVRSYPALTVNTITGFSPPDPSQLSPTGSGYGDSFRPSPSPAPQPPIQYQISYLSPQVKEPTYPAEAWEKAQAALSSLQSDDKGVGC